MILANSSQTVIYLLHNIFESRDRKNELHPEFQPLFTVSLLISPKQHLGFFIPNGSHHSERATCCHLQCGKHTANNVFWPPLNLRARKPFGVIYHTRSDLRCHPMCLLQRRWRLFSIELRELDFKFSYDREQRKLHWSSFTHHTAHVQRYCSWVSDKGGSKRRLFVCFQVMRMFYGLSSASLFSQGCPEGRE